MGASYWQSDTLVLMSAECGGAAALDSPICLQLLIADTGLEAFQKLPALARTTSATSMAGRVMDGADDDRATTLVDAGELQFFDRVGDLVQVLLERCRYRAVTSRSS